MRKRSFRFITFCNFILGCCSGLMAQQALGVNPTPQAAGSWGGTHILASSFNWAKLLASFSSGAASNLYYPKQDRGLGLTLTNVGIGYVTEMGLNALKEFWPDLKHLRSRNRKAADSEAFSLKSAT